jgi:hypothetical protein
MHKKLLLLCTILSTGTAFSQKPPQAKISTNPFYLIVNIAITAKSKNIAISMEAIQKTIAEIRGKVIELKDLNKQLERQRLNRANNQKP